MAAALALQRAWLRRGPLARLLWPLSLLFAAAAGARRAAFRAGVLRRESVAVPVVVVGNVVAGGAGKTPLVIELVRHLQARGLEPGVISRGHGRSGSECLAVRADSDARAVGDEPLLIVRVTGVPVVVGASRVAAARALLAACPECRVIVSDDGLQHERLARDLEICVFDERGTGNGWLLPAGPLRERWPRAADLVVRSGNPPGIGGFEARRQLAPQLRSADGTQVALASLAGRAFTAVAAIGRPEAFFAMLRASGLQPTRTIALPDHHDFAVLPQGLESSELVCTEKDAVKLWRLRPDAWAAPLELQIEPAFWTAFDRLLDAKLSSRHGSQTA